MTMTARRNTKTTALAARLLVLLAATAVSTLSGCLGGDDAPSPGPSTQAPQRGQPERGGSVTPAESLDLEAMLVPVPEYEGQGRNLFAYGPVRSAAVAPPVERPVVPPPPPTPTPTPRPPTPAPRAPAPARLDVKYAGFLEKTNRDGGKAKYAIFLDGNEILAGAEGETVANRFTIVEIGLESVTVSAQGSNATERIPLQSN